MGVNKLSQEALVEIKLHQNRKHGHYGDQSYVTFVAQEQEATMAKELWC